MGQRLVRIRAADWAGLRDLQRVYDLDVFGPTARELSDGGFEIQGLLTDEQAAQLGARGYEIETLEDAERVASERLQELRDP
ncbi:MAG TPA: hypothetical protein VEQ42_02915, partial [Pyrinomonadaceae bacterium]|nr:hypothetical protein [Pyrinomonadaceae bacterium]